MIHNITVHTLPHVMEAEKKTAILIDVREPIEFNTLHIPNSKLMPLSDNLQENLQRISSEYTHWIFLCQHGVRSRKAATLAESLGKNVTISHVVGGVSAWAHTYPIVTP